MTNQKKLKKFLTINEQIDLLINKGLKIVNKEKFISYLKKYNYQNFVNGYNDLLFVNQQRTKDKYKDNVNSDDLISIFEFDKSITHSILKYILNIERIIASYLNTTLCEIIGQKYNEHHGQILDLPDESYHYIFPRGFKFFKNTFFNSEPVNPVNKIKDELNKQLKNLNSNEDLSKSCKKNNAYPLWSLSVYWTFGNIKNLIHWLNDDIVKQVINKFQNNISQMNPQEFRIILNILNNLRNRCCHNNVIYNFNSRIEIGKKHRTKWILLNDNYRQIKIYDLVRFLEQLTGETEKLKNEFQNNVNKHIKKSNVFDLLIKTLNL